MDSQQRPLSNEVISPLLDRAYSASRFAKEEDEITDIAFQLWLDSQVYKQNRMNRVGLYERLYNNELPRKERQLFNICLPIMGGFEDALQANMTDPVKLTFHETNPQDYLIVPKVQALWEQEKDGLQPNQMWNSKARDLMHDALLSGRAIAIEYAENDPVYRNVFDTVNYSEFHCQPLGGGYLENHLFVGQEGIYMTLEDIISNESFPLEQRKKVQNFSFTNEYWQYIEDTYGTHFARFKSMYLNIQSNTFSGAKTLFLNQFIITRHGVRYKVLFDPISKIWLSCEKLRDINGSDLYPYKSAATHQDSKNFWSKGFSDDIFAIALTISTLLNQELTNREKSNFNARAYDPAMFTDEAKLDAAQYIPDRLVPADTMAGTRKIEDGIYSFQTPQLQGTINLIEWMQTNLGQTIGLADLSMPQQPGQKGKKQNAAVQIAQQAQVAKRIGFKAEPFKEMFGQIGEAYVQGLKEFMPGTLPVKLIGEDGYTEEGELKRLEITRAGDIGIKVVSTSSEELDNQTKKNARIQALSMVAEDPNVSSQWRTEATLKTVGGFTDEEIKIAMEVQSYGSKKQIAHASKAIQELLKGKMPDIYYNADAVFLQYLQDFVTDNKNKVMKRKVHPQHGIEVYLIALFGEYMNSMAQIVQQNELRKQAAAKQKIMQGQGQGQNPAGGMNSGQQNPGKAAMPGIAQPA